MTHAQLKGHRKRKTDFEGLTETEETWYKETILTLEREMVTLKEENNWYKETIVSQER